MITVSINAKRLYSHGVNVAAILRRPVGDAVDVTEDELDSIMALLKFEFKFLPVTDILEFL